MTLTPQLGPSGKETVSLNSPFQLVSLLGRGPQAKIVPYFLASQYLVQLFLQQSIYSPQQDTILVQYFWQDVLFQHNKQGLLYLHLPFFLFCFKSGKVCCNIRRKHCSQRANLKSLTKCWFSTATQWVFPLNYADGICLFVRGMHNQVLDINVIQSHSQNFE